jgi:hypothetical protein
MAKEHVEAVFGPQYVQDALKHERENVRHAERIVLRLRELLIGYDPSLPHPLDGRAWAELEAIEREDEDAND